MEITKAFEGYIWFSDSQLPVVYEKDKEESIDLEKVTNPFIIEGYLSDGMTSYSIKMIDGEYKIQKVVLDDEKVKDEKRVYTPQQYISNRMGEKKLLFRQYWQKVSDPYCEGMDTLLPAEFVFEKFEK